MMTTITVRRGLRRLEFLPAPNSQGRTVTHVVVEFAHDVPLNEGQVIRVDLGIREGNERALEGVPKLVRSRKALEGDQYVYRIEGDVV
jgi:hypothetical protein